MHFLTLFILIFVTTTTFAAAEKPRKVPKGPNLKSEHVLVLDEEGKTIISKNAHKRTAIASITKLMTAMVVLDAKQNMNQILTISKADRDRLKLTGSRLNYGAKLKRKTMLKLALSASENRAAHVLSRYFPGGKKAFVRAMNAKAKSLGMSNTRFRDPTGLSPGNVSTAHDLAIMVDAAYQYPFIRKASTTQKTFVRPFKNRAMMEYWTTNRFLQKKSWKWRIYLTKTGYIKEAGRCLVMRARTANKTMTIVLLNSFGKLTPYGDSNRIRKWLGGSDYQKQMAWSH